MKGDLIYLRFPLCLQTQYIIHHIEVEEIAAV